MPNTTGLTTIQPEHMAGPQAGRLTGELARQKLFKFESDTSKLLQDFIKKLSESNGNNLDVAEELQAILENFAETITYRAEDITALSTNQQRKNFFQLIKKFDFNPTQYALLINKISSLIQERNESDDNDEIEFLNWLQDKVIYAKVFAANKYVNIIQEIKVFKEKCNLTFLDKFFRVFVAFNSGIGNACNFYNLSPILITNLLAAVHVVLPPVGLIVVSALAALITLTTGAVFFRFVYANFHEEDEKLNKSFNKSVNEVYHLANEETELVKELLILDYQIKFYKKLIHGDNGISLAVHNPHNKNKVENIADKATTKKSSIKPLVYAAIAMAGTAGAMWGVPSLVLGAFGVPLLTAGVILTWPAGVIVALLAVTIVSLITFVAYRYNVNSQKASKKIENIKKENGLGQIQLTVEQLRADVIDKRLEKERLERKLNHYALQHANPSYAETVQEHIAAINDTAVPIDTYVVQVTKQGSSKEEMNKEKADLAQVNELVTDLLQPEMENKIDAIKSKQSSERLELDKNQQYNTNTNNSNQASATSSAYQALNLFTLNNQEQRETKVFNETHDNSAEEDVGFKYA